MKFNVFLCSFIAIIFNLIIQTNSAYLFSSDLQFNIPESFKANFTTEADFEQFLKDLIHKLKTRIAEKLYQSFNIRNKIKQNVIKINKTNGNIAADSLEKINDISHNFRDFVRRVKTFEYKSFEKMINNQLNKNNIITDPLGIANENGSGFLNETNLKNKNLKIIQDKNKNNLNNKNNKEDKKSNPNETEIIKNSTLIKESNVNSEDYSECDFEEFDVDAKKNISDRNVVAFINNDNEYEDDYIDDESEKNDETQVYESFVNNNATDIHLDFNNKIKQRYNPNVTEKIYSKISANRNVLKNNNTKSIIKPVNQSFQNFYFFENEYYLNSDKSFYDFANVFFKSEKNFQLKIFGKKLIDFFSYDKLNLNDNLVNSFYKFYLNMKIDKKAVEDKKYSLVKKELDFFSLLEKEKNLNSSSLSNSNKNLKNNLINKPLNNFNNINNETLFLINSTLKKNNFVKKQKQVANKLKLLSKNETLPNLHNLKSQNKSLLTNQANKKSERAESANSPSFQFSSAIANKRTIKIFIDSENECDVFFEDKVYYEADNFTNYFLDHIIINRKSNFIEPRGVKANNASIKYFVFNRKLNMFSIDVDKDAKQNFTIDYDYMASGLIGVMTNDIFMNPELEKNLNLLKWKVYNENTDNKKLNLEIQVFFGLGEDYDYDKIKFNHAFVKKLKNVKDKKLTYFSWSGDLLPYEVMTINSFFPMIFRNCGIEKLNIPLVILGSLFVILVIISVYLMIVNIIKDFY